MGYAPRPEAHPSAARATNQQVAVAALAAGLQLTADAFARRTPAPSWRMAL